jgi:hypothetical protein
VPTPGDKEQGFRKNGEDCKPGSVGMYASSRKLDNVEDFRDGNRGLDADIFCSKCFIWGVAEFDIAAGKTVGIGKRYFIGEEVEENGIDTSSPA